MKKITISLWLSQKWVTHCIMAICLCFRNHIQAIWSSKRGTSGIYSQIGLTFCNTLCRSLHLDVVIYAFFSCKAINISIFTCFICCCQLFHNFVYISIPLFFFSVNPIQIPLHFCEYTSDTLKTYFYN